MLRPDLIASAHPAREHLAVMVHLAQFALGFCLVARPDHHTDNVLTVTRSNREVEFLHVKSPSSGRARGGPHTGKSRR